MCAFHAPVRLGSAIQSARKAPGFVRCLIGFRQVTSPYLLRQTHQKSGSFPPLALPSLSSTTTLSDTRRGHRRDDGEAATSAPCGPPPITRLTLPPCRAPYPDGPERVRLSVASPLHAGLPRLSGGSASMTSLSRPAQASRALRPAGLLNRPKTAFVTRLQPARLPDQAARQLPGPTDNYLGGSFLHW
jgi:hypothetical protein